MHSFANPNIFLIYSRECLMSYISEQADMKAFSSCKVFLCAKSFFSVNVVCFTTFGSLGSLLYESLFQHFDDIKQQELWNHMAEWVPADTATRTEDHNCLWHSEVLKDTQKIWCKEENSLFSSMPMYHCGITCHRNIKTDWFIFLSKKLSFGIL